LVSLPWEIIAILLALVHLSVQETKELEMMAEGSLNQTSPKIDRSLSRPEEYWEGGFQTYLTKEILGDHPPIFQTGSQ
jgi:hypothetical protein